MMGALKGELFPTKILNKNSLSLAHCVLNRTFTVYISGFLMCLYCKLVTLDNVNKHLICL